MKKESEQARQEYEEFIAKGEKQKDSLESELKNLNGEIDKLSERKKSLNDEVSGLQAQTNALTSQMPVLQSAFDSLSKKLDPSFRSKENSESDIWQPVLASSNSKSVEQVSEMDALSNLRTHLENEGLKFHQRTINSFHTALKTTDSSPLVVLAGVSGTGKS